MNTDYADLICGNELSGNMTFNFPDACRVYKDSPGHDWNTCEVCQRAAAQLTALKVHMLARSWARPGLRRCGE